MLIALTNRIFARPFILTLFILAFCAASVQAQERGDEAAARLLIDADTFEANFDQILLSERGAELERSSGRLFLRRPDKFRWDYRQPYRQTIVTNGQTLWIYDEDLEQVTSREAGALFAEGAPAAMLLSRREVEKHFTITELGNIEQHEWLELTPKEADSHFNGVRIGFEQGRPVMMIMFDNFGQTTRIDFTEAVVNHAIDDHVFDFEPPSGVDLIDEYE